MASAIHAAATQHCAGKARSRSTRKWPKRALEAAQNGTRPVSRLPEPVARFPAKLCTRKAPPAELRSVTTGAYAMFTAQKGFLFENRLTKSETQSRVEVMYDIAWGWSGTGPPPYPKGTRWFRPSRFSSEPSSQFGAGAGRIETVEQFVHVDPISTRLITLVLTLLTMPVTGLEPD
ncbi:hypothetical protein PhaeoP72_00198 [Phaeobacter inhibens]|nr:hypothetical protein PhaeoP72_00198 [Phaeobacter inhibens]